MILNRNLSLLFIILFSQPFIVGWRSLKQKHLRSSSVFLLFYLWERTLGVEDLGSQTGSCDIQEHIAPSPVCKQHGGFFCYRVSG